VIRRAAKHSVAEIGDTAMNISAAAQILLSASAEVESAVALPAFLEGQGLEVLRVRLHIVDCGNGPRPVTKRRVRRDIAYQLLADVDGTPVTELFQVFRTGFQHVISLP